MNISVTPFWITDVHFHVVALIAGCCENYCVLKINGKLLKECTKALIYIVEEVIEDFYVLTTVVQCVEDGTVSRDRACDSTQNNCWQQIESFRLSFWSFYGNFETRWNVMSRIVNNWCGRLHGSIASPRRRHLKNDLVTSTHAFVVEITSTRSHAYCVHINRTLWLSLACGAYASQWIY